MSSKTVIEVGMAAGVAVGVIIWAATGAVWHFFPIAAALWVAHVVRVALDRDAAPPANGEKR